MKAKYIVKGKSGQERANGAKSGGEMFHIQLEHEHVQRIVEGVLETGMGEDGRCSKLAQLMFAYGMTAAAREKVGYAIPGAVTWEDKKEAPLHVWTDGDTEDFLTALQDFEDLESSRAGGPNTVELRGFYRALHMAKMEKDVVMGMAVAQKIKHADNEELAQKVWEKVEAGLV